MDVNIERDGYIDKILFIGIWKGCQDGYIAVNYFLEALVAIHKIHIDVNQRKCRN
jgi:hypothetical protein